MEVAGMVLGTLSLVGSAIKKYEDLLRITQRSEDVGHIRTRVLLERARFETSLQHLSRFQELPPDVEPILTQMRQRMDLMMDSLIKYTHRQERKSAKAFGALISLQGDRREMEDHLQQLSQLNSLLEATCTQLRLKMADNSIGRLKTSNDTIEGQKRVKEPLIGLSTDHNLHSSGQGHHLPEKETQGSSALKKLATSCSLLLKLRGTEDPSFAELSNRFELWRHGVESERFYQAIKLDPRQDLRHDLTLLLYQAMLHIGETIALQAQLWYSGDHGPLQRLQVRETLDEFASISIQVREVVQDLDLPPPITDADGSKDDLEAATIQTLELVIDTLRDCLPSIVSFSRSCMTLENNIPAAEEVTELLEASVKLIRPGSEALSRAAAVVKAQPDKSSLVDMESITEVFDRQAVDLEKWVEKHKQGIETKLASKNPAKLASVADAVENITFFLDKFPGAVDDQFGKASASMKKGSPDSPSQETVESIVKSLETYVQSLVALESQLDAIELLPPYSKSSGDRVVIDMISGEIMPAS